jgi:hypothetical protein
MAVTLMAVTLMAAFLMTIMIAMCGITVLQGAIARSMRLC